MRSWLPFIFLFTGFSFNSFAAEGDPKKTADSLRGAADYATAALFYEKAAWSSVDQKSSAMLLLSAAECHSLNGDHTRAYALLSPIPAGQLHDSLAAAVKSACALAAYLQGQFGTAESEIKQVRYLTGDSALSERADMLLVVILHEQFRWREAHEVILRHMVNRYRDQPAVLAGKKAWLDSLYLEKNLPRLKNERTAMALATWLPGMGQAYAGRTFEGIVSLGAMLVSAGGMVVGIVYQYYFTSAVIGNILIAKFYQGSLARTGVILRQTNYNRTQPFNLKLKQALSEELKR